MIIPYYGIQRDRVSFRPTGPKYGERSGTDANHPTPPVKALRSDLPPSLIPALPTTPPLRWKPSGPIYHRVKYPRYIFGNPSQVYPNLVSPSSPIARRGTTQIRKWERQRLSRITQISSSQTNTLVSLRVLQLLSWYFCAKFPNICDGGNKAGML